MILILVVGFVSVPQVMAYEHNNQSDEAEKSNVLQFGDSYDIVTHELPFSFNLILFDEISATISFSSTSEVQSLSIEQIESKNVIDVSDSSEIELLIGKKYFFEVIYQEKDCSIIYNGYLTPVLCMIDSDGQVIIETGNVVKNIIEKNTPKDRNEINPLAAGTIYESEPNNTYSTADRTYDDYDNYGALSTTSDVDWWVVSFSSSGEANFWLGNIPSGCDYDLYLYASNGTTLLATSRNGGNSSELITYPVSAYTNYYIRIYSYSGSSSSQYLFRARNYPSGINITIEKNETVIPQNISAVSRSLPDCGSNACYDYNSSFKPYSGWVLIDYDNSTGKVGTLPDRVLRQMKITVTVRNGATPVSGAAVSLSTSLGSNAYIYTPSTTTNSNGQLTAYIEFYSNRTFTVTATCNGTTKSQTVSAGEAVYKNKFYMSLYLFPKRSNYPSWAAFEDAVQTNGTGYDDINNQWYKFNKNGNIIPISGPNNTASGTTPTEYRTIAVDSPYITRKSYVSDGSSSEVYHRGRVFIQGLNNVLGDSGYRTAEDAGSKVNGYHIDLFIGFKTIQQFNNIYGSYIPKNSGYYFPQVTYSSTLKGSV